MLPGGVGDQQFNAQRIHELELGRQWNGYAECGMSLGQGFRNTLNMEVQEAFSQYFAQDNFTDDLDSAVLELEALGHMRH